MRPAAPPRPPVVQHGETLTLTELHEEALKAVQGSGLTQKSVADKMGLSESWISRALSSPSTKYAGAQRRIIAVLTDYEVTEEPRDPVFRVERKA